MTTRLRHRPGWWVGATTVTVVAICALVPGVVTALMPGGGSVVGCSLRAPDGSYQDRLAPSGAHWFGTDTQGCDEFDRVVHGARASLVVGAGAGLLSAFAGMLLGAFAGWFGGALDALVRRASDVTLAIPFVVGAILLLSVLAGDQRSPGELLVVLIVLLWPAPARLARAQTRSLARLEFVDAARAAGAGSLQILRFHILPHLFPMTLAYGTSLIGLVIGGEAVLTYLGVGLQIPSVSWGLMIDAAQGHYATEPHLLLFPGAFLAATVAGFVLLGDALSDVLDVRRDVA